MLLKMAIAPAHVDPRRGRFNQGVVTTLILIAFVVNWPLVIPAVMTVLLLGSVLGPRFDAVLTAYLTVIAPHLPPSPDLEDPRPMRFAAGLEAGVLAVATAAFMVGSYNVAWGLALGVAILAGISATTDICVGCAVYRAIKRPRREERPRPAVAPTRAAPIPQSPPVNLGVARRWQAGWAGLRRLGHWVTVVNQNPDGDIVVRAGSEWFLLRQKDQRFWPLTVCMTCRTKVAEIDTARSQRLVQCRDCSRQTQSSEIL